MIVERRTDAIDPDAVTENPGLYEEQGFAIQGPVLGNLRGWYCTDFGALNQIIHIWGYDSCAERGAAARPSSRFQSGRNS